jgi:hypothetical protein
VNNVAYVSFAVDTGADVEFILFEICEALNLKIEREMGFGNTATKTLFVFEGYVHLNLKFGVYSFEADFLVSREIAEP